ncbi:DUF802 domain-containing protein [Caballeronia sp. LZ062]|uniref:DUF802 domain-containing protein n=1 Tax=unclassified Caballeronia TaxID=2646786 RepID=UPI002864B6D6|nr:MULTISPECIES: DUF802 domain-containing protein [unclassified Caballeronia]MDR5856107.1 DUF802 domain-containing protein [Caballeronia sp. LZ050]MDR5872778.1 DUF802 domain-containing protein [Caballeronia sp. LZ062]
MPRYLLNVAVFLVGLLAVCGIAIGYMGSNALALAVTLVIGACYLVGASELQRYQQKTRELAQAVGALNATPASLASWLDQVPAGLRHAVRSRVEGERAALPGPALAPYLAGLLVLLGMLGTLLGMVATLRGTGAALESSTDLAAIRASLAAPVTGLGFAFGTSIAGVATSAMLGLLSTLCRRERLHVTQLLDMKTATTLRPFTQTYQREETLRLLQRQTEVMPKLVDRLQAMMSAMEQQSAAANERQLANQTAFHANTETAYRRLATSVELSLKQSVADSARAASAALQPVMQATMDGIAREAKTLHGSIEQAVMRQLDGLSNGFEASAQNIAAIWDRSLQGHQAANEALVEKMDASLNRFTRVFEERSSTLIEDVYSRMSGVSSALQSSVELTADKLNASLLKHEEASAALVVQTGASLDRFAQAVDERSRNLAAGMATHFDGVSTELHECVEKIAATLNDSIAKHEQASTALVAQTGASLDGFASRFEARASDLLEGFSSRLESTSDGMSEAWKSALIAQQQAGEQLATQQRGALDAAAARFEAHSEALVRSVDEAHEKLAAQLASNNDARLSAWTDALGAVSANLRDEWQQMSTFVERRQQETCETLARTAREMSEASQSHASGLIAEIERLIQAASQAPKAAAEVVAELRQMLSESMVRDTAMLEDRSRLLATLETLLDAVNLASTEQRTAVDALISTSTDLLSRAGAQFSEKVETEGAKIGAVAAQVTGSAVEVASLGEALSAAVESFGAANETLVTHLQRIETALDKTLSRSDEQLAYYVAQAREVIDLSVMSQKQIVEDLQRIAGQRELAGARA